MVKINRVILLPLYSTLLYLCGIQLIDSYLNTVDRRRAIQNVSLNVTVFDDVNLWEKQRELLDKLNNLKIFYYMQHIPSNARILDVGCGPGYFAEMLAGKNFQVVGVDISGSAVSFAEERRILGNLTGLEYVVSSVYDLPFPDADFDAVIISDTIEHLTDLPKAVEEISRVLKPEAVVLFDTFNRSVYSYFFYYLLTQHFGGKMPRDVHDWRLFTKPEEISDIFGDFGFFGNSSEWMGIEPNYITEGMVVPDFHLESQRLDGAYIGFLKRPYE